MSGSRIQRLEALFNACLELPEWERAPHLERNCVGEPDLAAEVVELLARDRQTDDDSLPLPVRPKTPVVRPDGLSDRETDAPPATIGPYRLLDKLGEGGFGDVYVAEQTAPVRRRVALKILKPGMDSRAVLARFDAERQSLALMNHPGVAGVLDAGRTPGGRPYFVMELVEGESITTFCERRSLSLTARLRLVIDVCRAVEHAHQKGIIHRDIKPSNILVTESDGRPRPRVIDFGIAKAIVAEPGDDALLTRPGEILGTPEYMSPEQAQSAGVDVDTRTDVYSLGVLLYRLLTGELPFDAARLREGGITTVQKILAEEEPPLPSTRQGNRALRGDLDWIVMKAMEKDRSRRYGSPAALADDLERHLRSEPVLAGPPEFSYRLSKLVQRRRGLVVATAAVLLSLLGGLAASTWQAVRATRAEEEARRQATTATAVSDFLTRMLGAANPEANPLGRRLTVREAADQAAREIDSHPPESTALHAAIRRVLGTTYMGIGLYDEAEGQLLHARGLLTSAPEDSPREIFELELLLADVEGRQGRLEAAETRLAALTADLDAASASDPELRARHRLLLGTTLGGLSRFAEADSLVGLAVAMRRTMATDSLGLAGALRAQALLRDARGQYEEAELLAREAWDITRRVHIGEHHDLAVTAGVLSTILGHFRGRAAAESLMRESIAIDQRVVGPQHPFVGESLTNLGVLLSEQDRLAEAEASHREARHILDAALGPDHPTSLVAAGNLATTLQLQGRLEEALELRRMVLDGIRRQPGGGGADAAIALNNLASLYRLLRRYPEAVTAFREARAAFEAVYGPRHPNVAIAQHNLGKTLLDDGRYRAAADTLGTALDLGRQVFPPGHANLAVFGCSRARALMALGRNAEAESLLTPAYRVLQKALGPDHPRTREAKEALDRLSRRS